MADNLPFCIHCDVQQLTADSRFCYRCRQPILPAPPSRRQIPPWVGPVLVSAAIVVVAAVVLARVQMARRAASEPAASTP